MQPQPGEDQHDDGDGEAEDEPGAKVDHLCIRITAGKIETAALNHTQSHSFEVSVLNSAHDCTQAEPRAT